MKNPLNGTWNAAKMLQYSEVILSIWLIILNEFTTKWMQNDVKVNKRHVAKSTPPAFPNGNMEHACAVKKQIKKYLCNDIPNLHINHISLLLCPIQVAWKGGYLLALLSYTVVTIFCSHECIHPKVSLHNWYPSIGVDNLGMVE